MPKPNNERKGNTTQDDRRQQSMDLASLENDAKQYQYMMEHDILTDCTFIVGRDNKSRKFRAHRAHVARVSPVFQAMFQHGETREAKTGNIRIEDVSPHTFQLLLGYIYGHDSETCYQESQDLAFAANKYQMKNLLEDCVARMKDLIEPENIWAAFRSADLLQQESLEKKCIQVLQRDTLRCITDSGFMRTSEQNVELLLEQDELNVDDEQLLVNAVVQWARNAARQRGLSEDDSGVRAVLEPHLLKLFRFLAMSHQQFMLGPGLSSWLIDVEKSAIAKCLRSGDFSKLPEYFSSITQKRIIVTPYMELSDEDEEPAPNKNFICKRKIIGSGSNVEQSNTYWSSCRNDDSTYTYICFHARLIFRAESNCKWLGFQCASRYAPATDQTALIHSTDNPSYEENIVANAYMFQHTLLIDYHQLSCGAKTFYRGEVEYNSLVTLMFDDPIQLVRNNWFSVEIKYRHEEKNKKVRAGRYPNPSRATRVQTDAGVKFVFYTENQKGYHHSANDGVFESLIFSL